MSNPVVLQDDFSGGKKRDFPQDALPPGALWECQDMLPNRVGSGVADGEYRSLETRGGWGYRTAALSGETDIRAIAYFEGAVREMWIAGDGSVYSSALGSDTTVSEGTISAAPVQNPVEFYDGSGNEQLVMFRSGSGVPQRIDNNLGAIVNMVSSDSAPAAYYGDVWKQRMWLGNTDADPGRVYFGGVGDVTSWDTTNDWIDTDAVVDGVASLRSVLLVFHPSSTTRFRGSPPDIIVEEAFHISPFDPFSWTRSGTETIVMASPEGLFITDGSSTKDLTKASGMSTWWREKMQESKDNSGVPTCPIGFANGWLCLNLQYSSFQYAFMINSESGAWFPATNMDFKSIYTAHGIALADMAGDEIWAGTAGSNPRGVNVYPDVFTQPLGDADGTNPTPLIETGFFTGKGPSEAPARSLYFTYNLGGATAISGTYKTNPRQQHTEYTLGSNLAVSAAADELKRRRIRTPKRDSLANGIAVRLTKAASSGNFSISSIEAEMKAREQSRMHYTET